ncbi:MAG: hypothetical protein Q9213_007076 [Squamulea squamosa]
MKVFLLGATGNLGSRLVPALLAHKHDVVIFVRSESKLKSLVHSAVLSQCTIINGDATNTHAVEDAILNNQCNALINSAGIAAIFPWQAPKMQGIIQAVATAAVEASKNKPKENLQWSMLAPSAMLPARKEITLLETPRGNPLVAQNDTVPEFSPSFLTSVPYIGVYADIIKNMMRYNTTLEDCANFLAADLTKGESEHVGHKVGIIVSNEKKRQ